MLILAVNAAGQPHRWLSVEDAVTYKAKGRVAYEIGEVAKLLRGGVCARTGQRSETEVRSIVSLKGEVRRLSRVPAPSRTLLFRRDRCLCAYCGMQFSESVLTMDHILPSAQGGPSAWENLVTACQPCNGNKGNRTPEQAGMPLLYVPYAPNRNEAFILVNRKVMVDQMEFLLAGVPKMSRLRA